MLKYQFGLPAVSGFIPWIIPEWSIGVWRSTIGRKWFECAVCHQEQEDHQLLQTFDMVSTLQLNRFYQLLNVRQQTFACKKCKRCFRKDTHEFEERWMLVTCLCCSRRSWCSAYSDEYCPHCDNHFVLEARIPIPALNIESEDARVDARMIKDDRIKGEEQRTIFNMEDAADKLG